MVESTLQMLFSLAQVKLVNIRNDDITDGNPKLTLGLIWTIILHFQVGQVNNPFAIAGVFRDSTLLEACCEYGGVIYSQATYLSTCCQHLSISLFICLHLYGSGWESDTNDVFRYLHCYS